MAIFPSTIGNNLFRNISHLSVTVDRGSLSKHRTRLLKMDGPSSDRDLHTSTNGRRITTLPEFLERTERLLQLEREAEYERNRLLIESRSLDELCSAGVALKKLRLIDRYIGLGGRRLLKFGYSDGSSEEGRIPLPMNKLSPGDTINLCTTSDHKHPLLSGVVAKVMEHSVTVAFDEDSLLENEEDASSSLTNVYSPNRKFVIVQSVNVVTFRRLTTTLSALKNYQEYEGRVLAEYFFGLRNLPGIDHPSNSSASDSHPGQSIASNVVDGEMSDASSSGTDVVKEPACDYSLSSMKCFNQSLNPSQRRAVHFCLNDYRPISIVHGPPGTGKTTVVVEIIRHLIGKQKKVLACAPSNVAVDNLVEKLLENLSSEEKGTLEFVRLGHPARTHSSIQTYSLDVIMKKREYSEVLDDIRKEIDAAQTERGPRRRSKVKQLRSELATREKAAISTVLRNANVIFVTLTSVTREGPLANILNDHKDHSVFSNIGRRFDVAVIDECGQATELSCWSALLAVSGEKCILAGDHHQLPPTVLSEEAAKGGYGRSLMSRAVEELGQGLVNMLTVQYRMNNQIMRWPSDNVYEGRLEAGDGVGTRLLTDLPGVEGTEETESPLWLIDTADCEMPEIAAGDDESKANLGEIRLVYLHVDRLVRAGVPQKSIAIISPYNFQVQLLRVHIGSVYGDVSVRSIDGYQGQERDAVILSLVRSNQKKEVGFLADRRRMNVAVTRAKRHLAIIADSSTVSSRPFLKSLIEYMTENGQVKSALEYEDDYHLVPFSINVDSVNLVTPKSTDPTMPKNSKTEGKKTVGKEAKHNRKTSGRNKKKK